MDVCNAFAFLVDSLERRTPEVEVLVAAGSALALEIDTAQLADDKGKTRSAAAPVTALRGVVADLMLKGSAQNADFSPTVEADWSAPQVVPAVADLAKVRNAKKPAAGNARPRSDRGGSTAG